MAELDAKIALELDALAATGADRIKVETRYAELCQWAIAQCNEADAEHQRHRDEWQEPIDLADEAIIVMRLWSRIKPMVDAGIKAGRIAEIVCLELCLCEDGHSVCLFVESDDIDVSLDLGLYWGEDFYAIFIPSKWQAALAGIAADLGAETLVLDHYRDRLENPDPPGWTRIM